MVDITQKPYFEYENEIKPILDPIRQHVDVQFMGFGRVFADNQRFIICNTKEYWIDFYDNDLYRYSTYENKYSKINSAFHMWDHLPYAPPEIYQYCRKKFNFAHGLSIIQQHGNHCDFFAFTTQPGNDRINNFYLNHKDLLEDFTKNFYIKMVHPLSKLATQTFMLPHNIQFITHCLQTLTPRQQDCAKLLIEGANTKEIAQILMVSPRTIETHIDAIKNKFNAKNRPQLVSSLSKMF